MTAKAFCKKYADAVNGGFTKVKVINRARKWGLSDRRGELYEYLGPCLTLNQCEEFVKTNDKHLVLVKPLSQEGLVEC